MTMHTHFDSNDQPVYIESKSYPITNDYGKVTAVIETCVNITEKRALEEQLRHSQKMDAIGTLAGGIAHDFRNLLNVIVGYGSIMEMHMPADHPDRPKIAEIMRACDRAADLTKGILAFSRKQTMSIKPEDMNSIVRDFHRMVRRVIGEDIVLETSLSEKELTIQADRGQVEQVLMNFATNARDAMPRGGVLSLATELVKMDRRFMKKHGFGEPGMYALASVSDTGTGMDSATRQRIFEPFFTTKEVGKGTGLGLSIVHGIVMQHNGYIECESEPGKGTTFKIYLPMAGLEAAETRNEDIAMPSGGTETVLVAEDDPDVRKLFRSTLRDSGYKVIEAADGAEAVAKFRENSDIAILVFDVMMPEKNGWEAYEDIRGIRSDIKVIFVSGYSRDSMRSRGISGPEMQILPKPAKSAVLLRMVRDLLNGGAVNSDE